MKSLTSNKLTKLEGGSPTYNFMSPNCGFVFVEVTDPVTGAIIGLICRQICW